jgi:hypothetical protein
VKEYNVPRLYLYQAVIEEWGKAGTVDQSHDINKLWSKAHPNQTEFPPVIGKTSDINRLT